MPCTDCQPPVLVLPGICCRARHCPYQASSDVVVDMMLQQVEDIVPHLIKQDRSETFRAAVARMKASSGAGSRPGQTGPTTNKVGGQLKCENAPPMWRQMLCWKLTNDNCHQCTVRQGGSQ